LSHQSERGLRSVVNFVFKPGDNLDLKALCLAMEGCDMVFHLAANADVQFGLKHPSKDLHQILQDAKKLRVLGDGNQRKSYLYVQDCISAVIKFDRIESLRAIVWRV
jgi:nucleoside-diphosphate-sugar epimerase